MGKSPTLSFCQWSGGVYGKEKNNSAGLGAAFWIFAGRSAILSFRILKEGKDWFLRIYIDKPEGEGYIGTEDCEKVSRFFNKLG